MKWNLTVSKKNRYEFGKIDFFHFFDFLNLIFVDKLIIWSRN